jgi:hypothetical protein
MKFCEKYEVDTLKIIIIIIGYILNNFTTHVTISYSRWWKMNSFLIFFQNIKNEFIFWKIIIIIHLVNVETDPRLRYLNFGISFRQGRQDIGISTSWPCDQYFRGKNIENWSSGFVWVIYFRSLAFETVKTIYLVSQTILGINKHHTLIVVATSPLFKCEISQKYDK